MPVTVDSSRLQKRLRNLTQVIRVAPQQATVMAAREVLTTIINEVRNSWRDNNQVGFDLDSFVDIINSIEVIDNNSIGLLNTQRMGTEETFERIRGIPGLWHQGTGANARFGLFVNQLPLFFDQVAELAQARQNIWGSTQPQWWLIEYGSIGGYDPRPPTLTITNATIGSIPRVRTTIESTINRMLRERGVV